MEMVYIGNTPLHTSTFEFINYSSYSKLVAAASFDATTLPLSITNNLNDQKEKLEQTIEFNKLCGEIDYCWTEPNCTQYSTIRSDLGDFRNDGGDQDEYYHKFEGFLISFSKLGVKEHLQEKAVDTILRELWKVSRYFDYDEAVKLKPLFETIKPIPLSQVLKYGSDWLEGFEPIKQKDGQSEEDYLYDLYYANEDIVNTMNALFFFNQYFINDGVEEVFLTLYKFVAKQHNDSMIKGGCNW